jgi:flagellar export protein FliJ
MKRFQFPLDRVRRWREEEATLEELKLEGLYGRYTTLEDEKARAAEARASSEREVLGRDSIDAGELQALDAFRRHVRVKTGQIETRQRELRGEIEQQRVRLMEAQRRAELLERLKKKKFEEWRTLADREEEAVAGELYLAKWRR